MRIALAVAPGLRKLEIYQSIGIRAPPLGLAYIASVLESMGHKVRIIDAPTLEMSVEETTRELLSENPDIVGISSVTPTAKSAYRMACLIREADKGLPVIVGGPHVSFMIKEALGTGCIDYVAVGEGEYTMAELTDALKGKRDPHLVPGLAYLDGGRPKLTRPRPYIENLDVLPKPARHLLPMDHYTLFDKPIRMIHVIASRGCPYGCIYCSTSYFWGRKYRIRSPQLVADEIEEAVDKYRTNIVVFTDDELTLSRRWVYGFLKELEERKLDIYWTCGTRVSSINRDMLVEMAKHGCGTIYYGVESYKDEDLERIRKKISIEQVRRAVEWTKEAGIETAGSFILGFPWHNADDVKKTVKFAEGLEVDYAQFTVATPYPGTPLYETAKRDRLIEVWDWDFYTTVYPVMRGLYLTRDQIGKLLGWAYRSFYLRPAFLFTQLARGRLKVMLEIAGRAIRSALSSIRKNENPKPFSSLEEFEQEMIKEVKV